MGRRDRDVPARRPARREGRARVLTVSERTKHDLVELYGVAPEQVVVTPNGVDPAFRPDGASYKLRLGPYGSRSARCSRARTRSRRSPPPGRRGSSSSSWGRSRTRASRARSARGARSSRLRAGRAPRRALPGGRLPRAGVAPRGLRTAGGRGDGVRHAGRRRPGRGARRGRRRRRDRRRGAASRRRDPPALADRARLRDAGLERARSFTWEATARRTVRVYVEALGDEGVSAVVVSHGHAAALETLLPLLAPQVDELLVIANLPGSLPAELPPSTRVLENTAPRRLAANVNLGVAATADGSCCSRTPTRARPERGRGAPRLRGRTRACGVAGPRTIYPDGTWQPSRRRFPTVGGTLVRRTPLRRVFPPLERQRGHYLLDETSGARRGRLDARRLPAPAPRDARRARRLGRGLPALRRGHRPLLPRHARRLGALVRARRARDARLGAGRRSPFLSRHTLWHARGMARFVVRHPETLSRL